MAEPGCGKPSSRFVVCPMTDVRVWICDAPPPANEKADVPEMKERTVVSEINSLRQRQDELFGEARTRRGLLLAELAALCGLLGALTRTRSRPAS